MKTNKKMIKITPNLIKETSKMVVENFFDEKTGKFKIDEKQLSSLLDSILK